MFTVSGVDQGTKSPYAAAESGNLQNDTVRIGGKISLVGVAEVHQGFGRNDFTIRYEDSPYFGCVNPTLR